MSEDDSKKSKDEKDPKLRGLMVSKGGKEAEDKKAVDALLKALDDEEEEK
ncbi:MAG: hypothetical protein ACFFDI_10380 [Promethearchaeota archaeon]